MKNLFALLSVMASFCVVNTMCTNDEIADQIEIGPAFSVNYRAKDKSHWIHVTHNKETDNTIAHDIYTWTSLHIDKKNVRECKKMKIKQSFFGGITDVTNENISLEHCAYLQKYINDFQIRKDEYLKKQQS